MRRRFSSGSTTPASAVEKAVAGVDHPEIDAQVRRKVLLDLLALVQPQQPVVDEDAGEPVADGAVHQRGGDRRVDAAGEPADHALLRRRPAAGSARPPSR